MKLSEDMQERLDIGLAFAGYGASLCARIVSVAAPLAFAIQQFSHGNIWTGIASSAVTVITSLGNYRDHKFNNGLSRALSGWSP